MGGLKLFGQSPYENNIFQKGASLMIELLPKGNYSIPGNVAAGSLFSSLQSVGAGAGVGVAVKAVGGALGAGGVENRSNFEFGSFGVAQSPSL